MMPGVPWYAAHAGGKGRETAATYVNKNGQLGGFACAPDAQQQRKFTTASQKNGLVRCVLLCECTESGMTHVPLVRIEKFRYGESGFRQETHTTRCAGGEAQTNSHQTM